MNYYYEQSPLHCHKLTGRPCCPGIPEFPGKPLSPWREEEEDDEKEEEETHLTHRSLARKAQEKTSKQTLS